MTNVLFAENANSSIKRTNEEQVHRQDTYRPREILIKFKSNTLEQFKSALTTQGEIPEQIPESSSIGKKLKNHGLKKGHSVFSNIKKRNTSKKQNNTRTSSELNLNKKKEKLNQWYHYTVDEDVDLEQLVETLKKDDTIEYVEPNYEWKMAWTFDPPIENLPDSTTDPMYPQQWYLTMAGIQQSWNYMNTNGVCGGGNSDVVVAVIDSGVDYNHEELQANMWINTAEIPGNGIDDDNNGFVDDIHGCNVVSDPRSHTGDPMDMHGHGTHVSGIIAAQAFNNKGIIGTAFNTKIMAIRAAQYTGVLTIQDISEGIIYATEQGAEVINMSFGGYQYSQIVADALEVALSQAVLVASSGNDGASIPCYPAAYPYVIGVGSCDTSGRASWFSNASDILAPGESILSTLPNNSYASWSGTSMAAPIVSGIAALMRSYFWQRDIYSNRFLMASISGSGGVVNGYVALTTPPTPGVSMYENWIFDDVEISEENDGDGSPDSGETIHMAIQLINRSGAADNINLTLRAHAEGSPIDDPYVEIIKGTSHIPSMGPWSMYDNGFIYDEDGVVIGVDDPLIFKIDPNCPNEHIIPFELEITFEDGWNPESTGSFTRISRWQYVVTRGKNLPAVIEEDMDIYSDEYWIVGGPVLIETGATLTIHEGTQVQFGAISDDPYNPGPQNGYIYVKGGLEVIGTQEKPVNMFPSYLVSGQAVDIRGNDYTNYRYATIQNPKVNGVFFDHCYFNQDITTISAGIAGYHLSNCIFHRIVNGNITASYEIDGCLFDAGHLGPNSRFWNNNVMLQDNENDVALNMPVYNSYNNNISMSVHANQPDPNFTYASISYPRYGGEFFASTAETIANYFGGHLPSIHSPEDEQLLIDNFGYYTNLGISDQGQPTNYYWLDGTLVDYTNWAEDFPKLTNIIYGGWRVAQNRVRLESSGWKNYSDLESWSGWLMKLPGTWTTEQLMEAKTSGALDDYVFANLRGRCRYNAFLSKYWDLNTSHWMRFYSNADYTVADYVVNMLDNYWGTDSTFLIDHAITDYYDNYDYPKVVYGTPPSHGFESTYPFVDQVLINDIPSESIPEVGMGPTTFTIKFNRDMNIDPNYAPFVTFGPSAPHTDFVVKPVGSGWTDARTWEGTFWIVPVTGDGYHCMRISGAVAADDPWLVAGYDVGRICFEVKTMGILAMTLSAAGGEGRIDLTWQQDDFDMLAGYNLYRSTSSDGTYEKINDTIIPKDHEYFTDYDVTPAVPLYYKFTVLQTDYTESDFSNIASASPQDTIVPEILHTPVYQAVGGSSLRITATVTDNVMVESVSLYYRQIGEADYQALAMLNTTGDLWTVSISGSAVAAPGLEYYITATDGVSTVYDGTLALPHTVSVDNVPVLNYLTPNTGSTAGGTLVTLSGNLMQDGAEVYFGQEFATDIQFLSQTQIRCSTPPHYPAIVDVKVINPDTTECTLTNGFIYQDQGVVLSLPQKVVDYGTIVEVPLIISEVEGLLAASVTINYDSSVLSVNQVTKGGLIPDWSFVSNTSTGGAIQLSMAGASAVSGTGNLAVVHFQVIASPPASSYLNISSSTLNDGAISHVVDNGTLTVNGLFGINGKVTYYSNSEPVPGTTMVLSGSGDPNIVITDADGDYMIPNIPVGSYHLKPAKSNDVNEITAYDASLVLQADAGLINLSAFQEITADVNKNGIVSAMDASYILQKAVDLIELPFPGNQAVWTFEPTEKEYPLLNSDQSNQDFTALLVGDVSGNWAYPNQQAMMMSLSDFTPQATISIPDKLYLPQEQIIIPIDLSFEPEAEILSMDIEIHYDSMAIDANSVVSGQIITLNNMAFISNIDTAGVIKIAIAGTSSAIYEGTLATLKFDILSLDCNPQVLFLVKASLNEGAIETQKLNGSIASSPYQTDFSRNCYVNFDDLILLVERWLNTPLEPVIDVAPMSNGDNKINLLDFAELSYEWMN